MRLVFLEAASETFHLVESGGISETDFGSAISAALMLLMPAYDCVKFSGTFEFEGRSQPDLALIAKDLSHWFVIEVEWTIHSLHGHVLPQVRNLRYGRPLEDCAEKLASATGAHIEEMRFFVENVPRTVAVIADIRDPKWEHALGAVPVQVLKAFAFATETGRTAVCIDGTLSRERESIGFGTYSATDRSIVMLASAPLPTEDVQIEEPSGTLFWWRIHKAPPTLWLTRRSGIPPIQDGCLVQVIRTMTGRISLRPLGR